MSPIIVAHAPEPETAPAPANAPLGWSGLHLRLVLVGLGLLGLALSFVAQWLRPDQAEVFKLWAMAGLVVAAVPVLIDSLTSLKADGFEATKYYMDQFVALAILACFAAGQYVTGTIVAAILIVGQMLEEHATLGVEEAVRSLTKLSRVPARRVRPGGGLAEVDQVDASVLAAGDVVALRPGDTVPADGVVISGLSTLDQAFITGESLPVEAVTGSRVYAGTTNLTGVLLVNVTGAGRETVIGRVTEIVEEAKTSRAPVMRLIDRYTRYYMPLVLIIAGFVWFFTRDVERAIAVIIVTTPCAFVLASPSAMIPALAVASRLGILVKGSQFFEVAHAVDTVVFDKTGTLTTGRLRVTEVRPAPGFSDEQVLRLAGELEAGSSHPVARAVLSELDRREWRLTFKLPSFVEEIAGCGLRAGPWLVGRRDWLEAQGVVIPVEFAAEETTSTLYVADANRLIGAVLLADTLREESVAAIAALRAEGVQDFVMLTGDREKVAAQIARETGIAHYRAECLPEEKLHEVREIKATGRTVLVVGDGVNDAPALAAGDLGVAMGALGSDVAIKTADVALMGNDLRHLARFIALSRRTLALINQNLVWGSAFIVLFVVLSAFGLVSPIVAAGLHEFSAFFVIFNSARLLRFDDETSEKTSPLITT